MASSALLALVACALAQPALGPPRALSPPTPVGGGGLVRLPAVASNGALYLVAWHNPQTQRLAAARVTATGQVLEVPFVDLGPAPGVTQLSVAALPGGDFFVAFDAARDGGLDVGLLRVSAATAQVEPVELPQGSSRRFSPVLAQGPAGLVLVLRADTQTTGERQLQLLEVGAGGVPGGRFTALGEVLRPPPSTASPLFAAFFGAGQLAVCEPSLDRSVNLLRFAYPALSAFPPVRASESTPTAFGADVEGYLAYAALPGNDAFFSLDRIDADGGRTQLTVEEEPDPSGALAGAGAFTYLFQARRWATVAGTSLQPREGEPFAPGQSVKAAAVTGEQALVVAQREGDMGLLQGRLVTPAGLRDGGPFPLAYAPARMAAPVAVGLGATRLHVWTEERVEGRALYAALEPSADGGLTAPFAVCAAPGDEFSPAVAVDDTGFRVAFLSRIRSDANSQVRLARVSLAGALEAPCGVAIDGGEAVEGLAVAASGGRTLLAWNAPTSGLRASGRVAVVAADGAVEGPGEVPGARGALAAGGDSAGWFVAWPTFAGQAVSLRWSSGLPPRDAGVSVVSYGLAVREVRAAASGGLRALAWLERASPEAQLQVAYQVVEAASPFAPQAQRVGRPGPYTTLALAMAGGRPAVAASAREDAGTISVTWFELGAPTAAAARWDLQPDDAALALAVDSRGGAVDTLRREPFNGSQRLFSQAFVWAQPGERCDAVSLCREGLCTGGRCCERPCSGSCAGGTCLEEVEPGADGGANPASPFGYPCGCGTTGPLSPLGMLVWALLRARRGAAGRSAPGTSNSGTFGVRSATARSSQRSTLPTRSSTAHGATTGGATVSATRRSASTASDGTHSTTTATATTRSAKQQRPRCGAAPHTTSTRTNVRSTTAGRVLPSTDAPSTGTRGHPL